MSAFIEPLKTDLLEKEYSLPIDLLSYKLKGHRVHRKVGHGKSIVIIVVGSLIFAPLKHICNVSQRHGQLN